MVKPKATWVLWGNYFRNETVSRALTSAFAWDYSSFCDTASADSKCNFGRVFRETNFVSLFSKAFLENSAWTWNATDIDATMHRINFSVTGLDFDELIPSWDSARFLEDRQMQLNAYFYDTSDGACMSPNIQSCFGGNAVATYAGATTVFLDYVTAAPTASPSSAPSPSPTNAPSLPTHSPTTAEPTQGPTNAPSFGLYMIC